MSLDIAILYGSVCAARAGIRVARFLSAALRRRGHTTAIVDAAEQRLPLFDRMYKEYARGSAPPVLEGLAELYRKGRRVCDGWRRIQSRNSAGTEEFARRFLEEYFFRPSAIVSYSAGQFGGVRAAMRGAQRQPDPRRTARSRCPTRRRARADRVCAGLVQIVLFRRQLQPARADLDADQLFPGASDRKVSPLSGTYRSSGAANRQLHGRSTRTHRNYASPGLS